MISENILKDLTIINSEDKIISKKELISLFETQILYAGCSVNKWLSVKKSPYELLINDSKEKLYHIFLYLKNISGAGWKDKPSVKRVQVSNIKNSNSNGLVNTTSFQTNLILGIYNYDDNPIFVGWDAYRYINHNTIRSCYINIDTLLRGYKEEYLVSVNALQKIWVFLPKHFDIFLSEYIAYNKNKLINKK